MKKEENLTINALVEGMVYDASSWLAINVKSHEKAEVTFYTASQDEEETFENFQEFSNFIFDENFGISKNDTEVIKDINDKKSTISGCVVKEEEDYEGSKVFKILVSDGQIIDIYQNIAFENIKDLVKESKKALNLLEESEKELFSESKEYRKDPYAYYGVSRSDFF